MREIVDMLAKAVKELDNDQVRFRPIVQMVTMIYHKHYS